MTKSFRNAGTRLVKLLPAICLLVVNTGIVSLTQTASENVQLLQTERKNPSTEPTTSTSSNLDFNEKIITAWDGEGEDYFSQSIAVSGDTLVVGASSSHDKNEPGAAYVYTKSNRGWETTSFYNAKLEASDGFGRNYFGGSIATSGDTIVVGAYGAESQSSCNVFGPEGCGAPAVYVFEKPDQGWSDNGSVRLLSETAKLEPPNSDDAPSFGWEVFIYEDIDDDDYESPVILVTTKATGLVSGKVFVFNFSKNENKWVNIAILTASGEDPNNEFGSSIDFVDDTLVVGAPNIHGSPGAVYIYKKPIGGWATTSTYDAKLMPSDENDGFFGRSISISAGTVVVGAGNSAYVFEKPAEDWTGIIEETAKLTASDGSRLDEFGYSVGIYGNKIAIGAVFDDIDYLNPNQGSVYVYLKPKNGWVSTSNENAKILASDGSGNAELGRSLDIDSGNIYAGSYRGGAIGALYIFSPKPFLDLPVDYPDGFSSAVNRRKNSYDEGLITSWFDHNVPFRHDEFLYRWDGAVLPSSEPFVFGKDSYDGHEGIDFQYLENNYPPDGNHPVYPVATGTVLYVENDSCNDHQYGCGMYLYGNQIWIDHYNGYVTLYAHLKKGSIPFVEGNIVSPRDRIAYMGDTGGIKPLPPHLHFGLYHDPFQNDIDGKGSWADLNEFIDPFGWDPALCNEPDFCQDIEDPWVVPSVYLWKYPVDSQETYNHSPTVSKQTLVNSNPTNAITIQFQIVFSEAVEGVNSDDFILVTSNIMNPSITSVSGMGDTYTVTVNTGFGNGTIRLDLVDDNSIIDTAGNPLGGANLGDGDYMSGKEYIVTKMANFASADFNGDGKTDVAVFRPSNGKWYISGQGSYMYGQAGDIPVPADYNGDGKDDIAVFRPSNSTWYIYGVGSFAYGTEGDIPVVADYNGDGKDDIAVFRPSNSTWYIYKVGAFVYGTVGDIPVVADYDGDGKADIAVFRPSNSTWYIYKVGPRVYGTGGDYPVVADYDGDEKADIAVFRPSNSTWYIYGVGPSMYGTVGDIPVIGDYDGDGKADIAVFRPTNGTWYIYKVGPRVYGIGGDIPV